MALHAIRPGFALDKKTLRRHFISRRQALPEHERQDAALQVVRHLKSVLPERDLAAVIAAYLPHQHELDSFPVLEYLKFSSLCVALPVMPENKGAEILHFHRWTVGAWDDLRPGRHSIPVPQHGAAVTPDALLIPLVAFTRCGARLGYGGGWYDRTLKFLRKTNPEIPAIGLAFACQEADTLPTDPWDEPLTAVVTERGVISCAPDATGAWQKSVYSQASGTETSSSFEMTAGA